MYIIIMERIPCGNYKKTVELKIQNMVKEMVKQE